MGHLQFAARMAGLIKAIAVMMQENIPKNAAIGRLNPLIEEKVISHQVIHPISHKYEKKQDTCQVKIFKIFSC